MGKGNNKGIIVPKPRKPLQPRPLKPLVPKNRGK